MNSARKLRRLGLLLLRLIPVVLVVSGLTGMFYCQWRILRDKKAIVTIRACQVEMLKAHDQIGGRACEAVRRSVALGGDLHNQIVPLVDFYDREINK